jgi:predicted  nucleic acid-binding Zn-ribbon protein
MSIDELPDQLEAFLERARAVLNREIEKARAAVNALKSEEGTTRATIVELGDQRERGQKQLNTVLSNLHRGSTLVGLNHEIAEAHKTLAALKVETTEAGKAVEVLNKQRSDAKHQLEVTKTELQAAMTELQSVRAERGEAVTTIGQIKALLNSFA